MARLPIGVKIGGMDITLTAVYEEVPESEGGGYVAYAEELPGAITQGETLDEARENLRDAIELLIEANRTLSGQPGQGQKILRERIQITA
jgi:predicted RNase H-like HicB family nuclease